MRAEEQTKWSDRRSYIIERLRLGHRERGGGLADPQHVLALRRAGGWGGALRSRRGPGVGADGSAPAGERGDGGRGGHGQPQGPRRQGRPLQVRRHHHHHTAQVTPPRLPGVLSAARRVRLWCLPGHGPAARPAKRPLCVRSTFLARSCVCFGAFCFKLWGRRCVFLGRALTRLVGRAIVLSLLSFFFLSSFTDALPVGFDQ